MLSRFNKFFQTTNVSRRLLENVKQQKNCHRSSLLHTGALKRANNQTR